MPKYDTMDIYFNDTQYLSFHIWTHSLAEFRRVNDCYAYYLPEHDRLKTRGLFGHIHLGEVTHELVAHELQHFRDDYVDTRRAKDREKIALLIGDITGNFWREYSL